MPRKSKVDLLPVSLLEKLQRDRLAHPEWTIDDHLMALNDSHHEISRSSLGRWFKENPVPAEPIPDLVRAKTAALEAAVLIYTGDNQEELLSVASHFVQWIYNPQK